MSVKSILTPAVPSSANGSSGPLEAGGLLMGKRYTADAQGLELLCVRPGEHPVTVDGTLVVPKNAKPLPASD